jgi:hypothetical protein
MMDLEGRQVTLLTKQDDQRLAFNRDGAAPKRAAESYYDTGRSVNTGGNATRASVTNSAYQQQN